MANFYILKILLLSCFLISCKSNKIADQKDTVVLKDPKSAQCMVFDIRQCATDQFAEKIALSDNQETRETKMVKWLNMKGVRAFKAKLIINFHEFACEACDECPTPDRYFVSFNDEDKFKLEGLRLLNLTIMDCDL